MQSVPSEEADADADADAPSKVSDEKGEAETKTRVNNPVEVKVAEEDNSIPLTIVASDAKLLSAFCPIVAASRYPYKCIRGDLSQSVATQFFDKGKFWTREWDL